MNNFEIIILALALVFNSWTSYLNAGLVHADEPVVRRLYFSGLTFALQFIMAGTGIWIGWKGSSFAMKTNIIISLSIMLIVGLKVLLSGIRSQNQQNTAEYADYKSTVFTSLLEGIIPFFIGVAIGFLSSAPYVHWLLIGIFLLAGISAAFLTVIFKGKPALKLDLISGFLFLSVAIKLALNITGF